MLWRLKTIKLAMRRAAARDDNQEIELGKWLGRRTSSARANASQFSHLGERLSLSRGRPNMRLKLAGALVLREVIVSCPGGHGRSFTSLAPAGGSPAA